MYRFLFHCHFSHSLDPRHPSLVISISTVRLSSLLDAILFAQQKFRRSVGLNFDELPMTSSQNVLL